MSNLDRDWDLTYFEFAGKIIFVCSIQNVALTVKLLKKIHVSQCKTNCCSTLDLFQAWAGMTCVYLGMGMGIDVENFELLGMRMGMKTLIPNI